MILFGKAELTCAISNTCICLDDLQTSLTVGWLLMIFLTIFTLAGDLLLRYSSLSSSLCSSFSLSQHSEGLDYEPLFCLSPRVIRFLLFLSSLMHFLQRTIYLLSGLILKISFPLSCRQIDLPSICPSYLRSSTVKCFFYLSLPIYPKNETSQVKILGVLWERPSCTLAVFRLNSSVVKVLSQKRIKLGPSLEHRSGQILVSTGLL